MKKTWKNAPEYQRILEILDGYWLSEPDEKVVVVDMFFLKGNGETQSKRIKWMNPKYKDGYDFTTIKGKSMKELPIPELPEGYSFLGWMNRADVSSNIEDLLEDIKSDIKDGNPVITITDLIDTMKYHHACEEAWKTLYEAIGCYIKDVSSVDVFDDGEGENDK